MTPIINKINDLNIRLDKHAPLEERQFIHQQIRSFNDSLSASHRAIRGERAKPIDVFVYGEDDQLLGGLVADAYWGWLEIDDLWLHESIRGSGLGRLLLQMAESEALVMGCNRVWLRTFDFQAPGFYEKMGYQITGKLDDYPPGHTFYWLYKELSEEIIE